MRPCVQFGLVLICVALHGYAAAQSPAVNDPVRHKANPHFARLDANKDGYLSYAEARADKETARNFALFDENRDGRLSEDEFLKLKATQARRRAGVYISDGAITSKVKLAVLKAKDLKATDVHVETVAGVVRLTGEVETVKQVARAGQLAERVKGVKKIENKLTLRPEPK